MKILRSVLRFFLVLVAAGCVNHAAAQQITITTSTEYQTVDGMGATLKPSMPSATPAAMHDTLGASFIRIQTTAHGLGMDFDTNVADANPAHSAAMTTMCNAITTYHNAYPDFNFVISIMTPPTWMKDTTRDPSTTCSDGAGQCGGHLKPNLVNEFAQNLVVILKEIKRLSGVDIYAISLQNEPDFVEWYVSCVYTTAEYNAAFKVVGALFKQQGLTTRLIAAEDMTAEYTARPYLQTIILDTVSQPYLYATATHGYNDNGVTPNAGTISIWSGIARMANAYHKKIWMTETSGYPDDWGTAIAYADGLYTGLKYGQCSGWIWDTDGGSSCDNNYALMCYNASTNRSLVSKNFYAYIRPGAVMVAAASQDTSIHVVAFNQKTNRTITIVLVNQGAAKTITLAGSGLPATFTKYTTNQTKRCANEGAVSSTGSTALDASSVVSLIGTYTVAVRPSLRTSQISRVAGKTVTFGIDGRLWQDNASRRVAPGVYVVTRQDGVQQRVAVVGVQ